MAGTYNFQPRQPLTPSAVRSPFSSTSTTPINSAATSPRHTATTSTTATAKPQPHPLQLNLQASRHVKSPQSPLYVPAVLRQTERPAAARLSRHGSRVDVRNASNSPGGGEKGREEGGVRENVGGAGRGETGGGLASGVGVGMGMGMGGSGSASGTEEEEDIYELLDGEGITISKEAEEEWLRSEKLGEVVGSPTREHWRADAVSPICDFPGCRASFGIFMRRHHCRHCGHVFCAAHTPSHVPLDHNARFHPRGEPGRACEMCHRAYLRWDRRRLGRLVAIQRGFEEARRGGESGRRGRAVQRAQGAPGTCDDPADILNGGGIGWPQQHHVGSFLGGSVPRDWSWSTF